MPSSSDSKVQFYRKGKVALYLPGRSKLKLFLINLFKQEGVLLSQIIYVFCTDAYLLGLNRKFLKHDEYTDIITFNLSEDVKINGEVYISLDRIRQNAKIEGVSVKMELHRVIFHGALHLCGFKDKTTKDASMMRKQEDFYLRSYFRST